MPAASIVFAFFFILAPFCVEAAPASTKTAEDRIIENPLREYKKYSKRLKKFGPNAPFPEFKPLVDTIRNDLLATDFQQKIAAHPVLQLEFNEVMTYLAHINLTFSYENKEAYPYINDYDQPFPYRPTIEAIEQALRLFDKVERIYNPEIPPLYHFDRYAYHKHALFADPENVVFPTMRSLTFSDLIRIRSVPIGFVGVSTKTIRVDRYLQSPIEYWYHDVNHLRRLAAYLKLKLKAANAKTQTAKMKIYEQMDSFIEVQIMPNIHKLPKGSSEEDIAVRRLVRLIIFEIFHESAVAPDPDSIVIDLLRGPHVKTPFEVMRIDPQPSGDIEKLRTAVGNIQSGAKVSAESNPDNISANIHYYHDRDLGLLANVYNKLIYGYYDPPTKPSELIAPVKFRNADALIKASNIILDLVGADRSHLKVTDGKLRQLILSKEGKPELFNYEQLKPHEAEVEPLPFATDPITAENAIKQIQALGKNIHSIFGFSDAEYEDKEKVLTQIRKDLMKLDPKTTIINIGTTEAGIGAAYEIAKELGFTTIGIVSMQALSYSGKFSRFVDRIYILNDQYWGGYIPGTKDLTPTTKTYAEISQSMSAYGGGANTAAAIAEAIRRGTHVTFFPAEMNHAIANSKFPNARYIGAAEIYWQANHSELEVNGCNKILE